MEVTPDQVGTISDTLLFGLQVIGTVAFAISGALAAAKAKMDWFGAIVLSVIVSVGGGTLRDLLIGATPVFWVSDIWFILLPVAVTLLMIPLGRWVNVSKHYGYVLLADAAGLAVFVVLGTSKGLAYSSQSSSGYFIAIVLGVITGVAGGVIRDLLVGQTPAILVRGNLYATVALAGSALYVLLLSFPVNATLAIWIPVVFMFAARMIAIRRQWALPEYSVGKG